MKLPVLDAAGGQIGEIDADDSVFAIQPNLPVVHQAVLAYRANQRHGAHNTLNRSDIRQANAKSRRQKGGGRARLGGPSSPTRIGGAVAHGPHTRSYRQRLPKRMRRLAIRSMLSQRAAEGGIAVLAPDVAFQPRTAELAKLCAALGVERNALLLSDGLDPDLARGSRNLRHISSSPAETINTYLLITHDRVIMTEAALRRIESLWAAPNADMTTDTPTDDAAEAEPTAEDPAPAEPAAETPTEEPAQEPADAPVDASPTDPEDA